VTSTVCISSFTIFCNYLTEEVSRRLRSTFFLGQSSVISVMPLCQATVLFSLCAVIAGGKFHCFLLLGKSRLAVIRQMTIPRLELSAAVIAVRMDRLLSREVTLEI